MSFKPSQSSLPEARVLLTAPRTRHPFRTRRGGAWKVAYADFVTALLALFIVLWMMNSSGKVRSAISGYFRDPRGYARKPGVGPPASGEGLPVHHDSVEDLRRQLEDALRRSPDLQKVRGNIRFSMTAEGLRIDLLENEQGLFFVTGSASPTPAGEHLLELLAAEISSIPNTVVIEGHTDSRPFRNAAPSSGYGNWELSADRANAARRLLHAHGLRPQQVVEVRGFADQKLMNPEDPGNPRNRRVSLVVKFENHQ